MHSITSIFVALWSCLSIALAYDLSYFPPADTVAPANVTLTKLLLQGAANITKAPTNKNNYNLDITACNGPNDWAVTIDDGPSQYTPGVLKALADRGLKVTFFVIGSNVLKNPQILIDAQKAGHTLAIHTWSHPFLTTLSTDEIVAEIIWTARIIREVAGVTPTIIRPPCMFSGMYIDLA